ncbi:MAG: hypothetical protein IKZ90_01230 [Clostridiales bacterium]|nr:hypothetical protein [Clostridiales bacterium]
MKKNSTKKSDSSKKESVRPVRKVTAADLASSEEPSRNLREKIHDSLTESINYKAVVPRLLLLLTPVMVAFLCSPLLKQDQADFIYWWGMLYLFGWAAFPLTAYVFRGFVSAGYGFARSIGLLATAGPLWLLSYLGIWRSFNRPMTWFMFFLLIIISWGMPKTRDAAVKALSINSNIGHIIFEEVLFTVILVAFCFCKAIVPNINGQEKLMNYAFMNSMLRYDGLPAKDPWMAGESINYYYFGQYLFTYLTKMLNITPAVAYNLSMCTAIALPFASAFSLGQLFIDGLGQKKDCHVAPAYLPFAGLLSAFCTMIFGNSHSFFYDEQSFGNKMLFWKIWEKLGIDVGNTSGFFYPNSTRFIGHNPDIGDHTIHEFPFYSYLIGDLHAHVVSLTVVLLIIAFIFIAIFRAEFPKQKLTCTYRFRGFIKNLASEMKHIFRPEFFVCACLLGVSQMCNYWDFLIYFIFCSMGLLVYHARTSTFLVSFTSFLCFGIEVGAILIVYLKFGESIFLHLCLQMLIFVVAYILSTIFPSAFSRTGTNMAMLFALSSTIALSFNFHFDMISNMIALVDRHTSLFQFMIVWLIHILLPLSLVILVVSTKRHASSKSKLPVLPAPISLKRPDMATAYGERIEKNDSKERKQKKEEDGSFAEEEETILMQDPDTGEEIAVKKEKTSVIEKTELSEKISKEDTTEKEESSDEAPEAKRSIPRFLRILGTFFALWDYHFARFGDMLLCRFFRKRSIIDIFMVGMTVVGALLLLAPEIMYVRDIYTYESQRSNTMFKFTFAGFVILSLVVAYTVFRFMGHLTRQGSPSFWGLTVSVIMLILIIAIPGHYTLRSLEQRTGDIKLSNYVGLDGTTYLPDAVPTVYTYNDKSKEVAGMLRPYAEAIDWINENVEGSRNICEAYGYSYTERCIVAAYTGLPDIVGWQTHENLWRFHGWINPETGKFEDDPNNSVFTNYINPRHDDVRTIYTSTDVTEVFRLLHKYDVTYVICGSMELDEFDLIFYPCLDQIGEKVFTSSDGSLCIYKVQ